MAKKKTGQAVVCCDHQRRTCIQVERTVDGVKYIPLDIVSGLLVVKKDAKEFDDWYKPMVNYPVEKACKLYLGYAQTIGATTEALDYLGQSINVSKQEYDMATKKRAAKAAEPTKAAPKKKAAPRVKSASETKAAPKKAAPKATGEKKMSAAQLFQSLIMAGKLTDDQIFAKVQEQFGLDEKKRGYVKWYRNHLKKTGANPPEAK